MTELNKKLEYKKRSSEKLAYEMVPIYSLKPYEQNTKCHTKLQISKIAASIRNYGFDVPIVIDEDSMILKGHGRWEALKFLGREQVPVIRRTDLSEGEKRMHIISDNKLAESEWDPKLLIDEILTLGNEFNIKDLGFDARGLDKILPEDMLSELSLPSKSDKDKKEENRENMFDEDGERNPFYGESSMISELGDKELYKLSIEEFVDYHDDIIVNFSSGKDSTSSALWCFEHFDHRKINLIFANPGWRIEWPQTIEYIDYANDFFREKYGWEKRIVTCGGNGVSKFENELMQKGYMIPHMCFVQSTLKLSAMKTAETKQGWRNEDGKKRLKIISIRWEESKNREREYPERGSLNSTPFNYCSPIIKWSGDITAKYVFDHGMKLNPVYQFSPRAGCMCCPSCKPTLLYIIKEKYPESYKQLMEWHSISARKTGKFSKFIDKYLILPDEIQEESLKADSIYEKYAMTDEELIAHLERIRGVELPRPYFI